MAECFLCPRKCGAEREKRPGFCAVPEDIMIARAAPHFGEEPCISGVRGSGTVFFSGCNLRCLFCQNREISRGVSGSAVSVGQLREILLRLRDKGVHNINLVTGSHYSSAIAEALSGIELGIPVVWNSSAYESVEQLRQLEGLVQIYLPDYKYAFSEPAARWSAAPDYPDVAMEAIKEMYRQVGEFRVDSEGMLQKGLLIRHLIMPGEPENTLRVIDRIEDNLPAKKIMFSLMSQYTPMPGIEDYPQLQRRVSMEEYERCASYLDFSDIEYGFFQSPDSATDEMIPEFDGTGVL